MTSEATLNIPRTESQSFVPKTDSQSFIPKTDSQGFTPKSSQNFTPNSPTSPLSPTSTQDDLFGLQEEEAPWKPRMRRFLDDGIFSIYMMLLTLYTLFGDDIRMISFTKDDDLGFTILNIIALGCFTFELLLCCLCKPAYFNSFFFWLDLVSTASIIMDISYIWDDMVGTDDNAQTAAKAGKATRAGARAGRIIRVIRLIRLLRIVKLYKLAVEQHKRKLAEKQAALEGDDDFEHEATQSKKDDDNDESKSRVGKKLTELTTRRVIMLVLAMLIATPLFSTETWLSPNESGPYGLGNISNMRQILNSSSTGMVTQYNNEIDLYVNQHSSGSVDSPIIQFMYNNSAGTITYYNISGADNPDSLRKSEVNIVTVDDTNQFKATFDNRKVTQLTAILSIGQTLFVCFVLVTGALMFSNDASRLVLKPIERMIEKVKRIAADPLEARKLEDEEIAEEKKRKSNLKKGIENEEPNETVVLEKTIVKIGGLLALGFGEAGSTIIATNVKNSGGINPMIDGRKVQAIFGFCDIRQFTDATEILEERVMVFVNRIAEIVHSIVDRFSGAANKNIGDAFLLVWKFPEIDTPMGKQQVDDPTVISKMADMSLMAFLKIIARINQAPQLEEYKHDEALNARLPNYSVKMGFGLHVGWAIEGAIGSEYKIDASYLSPNVNMASRLEAATKQYGVPLLVSGPLCDLFSEQTKSHCRHIDKVTVKGSKIPVSFYTVDVDTECLAVDPRYAPPVNPTPAQKRKARRKRENARTMIWNLNVGSMFETDPDIVSMRAHVTQTFLKTFATGFQAYLDGDWAVARDYLEKAKTSLHSDNPKKEDGPATTLLSFMSEFNYVKPSHWAGYRELTDK